MNTPSLWRKFTDILACTVILLSISGTQGYAQSTKADAPPPAPVRHSTVTVIPERIAVKPGDEITLATQIDLADHWHVYWRNPGDSGLPVSIKWDLPEGFKVSEIDWPTPDKISYDVLVNYGYYNRVTLLQTLKIPEILPQGKIPLKASLELLVCNNICVPEYDEVALELNDPEHLQTDNGPAIKAAREKLPAPIRGRFSFRDEGDVLRLSLMPEDRTILSEATQDNAEFFPHDWGIINHAAMPEIVLDGGKIVITHARGNEAINLEKALEGLLVIRDKAGQNKGYVISATSLNLPLPPGERAGVRGAENEGHPLPDPQGGGHGNKNLTFISALTLAFLGGLILNLMPCVFPVLSIKALSLAQMKGQKAQQARLHGMAYTAGVVLSFLLIAGALIAFKHAGAAIGWGFQLQNPFIIALLAGLFVLIGLNLLGLFEIGSSLTGIGGKLTAPLSLAGSVFTGALAAIFATPCTAPFMGAAMGFALTQNAAISLSVFAVLGFGMALPYLLLSFIPALQTVLPRPGPWMKTLRQILSIPIFITALWLIWVLSIQTGILHTKIEGPRTAPYSNAALEELLKGSDPVFVEMTAAWCITCKVNESAVLNTQSTHDLFKRRNVQLVIGDWTNKNAEITGYMGTFKRNGVPLYVYYGQRDAATGMRPEAVLLPQILTQKTLRNTIENPKGDLP